MSVLALPDTFRNRKVEVIVLPAEEREVSKKNVQEYISASAVTDIIAALNSDWGDFEDSVQYTVALSQNVDFIITRNPGDYRESKIQVLLPEEALETIRFCFTSSVIYICFLPASLYAKIMLWTNDNMIKIEKLCPTT